MNTNKLTDLVDGHILLRTILRVHLRPEILLRLIHGVPAFVKASLA